MQNIITFWVSLLRKDLYIRVMLGYGWTLQKTDTLTSGSFPVKVHALVCAGRDEALADPLSRKPFDGVKRLLCLAMGRDTGFLVNGPYLGFAIVGTARGKQAFERKILFFSPAEEVFPSIVPCQREYPSLVSSKVVNLLTRLDIKQRDCFRISRRRKKLSARREGDCTDRLYQAGKRVQQPTRFIVEYVDRSVLVPARRKLSTRRLSTIISVPASRDVWPMQTYNVDCKSKAALRLIFSNLCSPAFQIPGIDLPFIARADQHVGRWA